MYNQDDDDDDDDDDYSSNPILVPTPTTPTSISNSMSTPKSCNIFIQQIQIQIENNPYELPYEDRNTTEVNVLNSLDHSKRGSGSGCDGNHGNHATSNSSTIPPNGIRIPHGSCNTNTCDSEEIEECLLEDDPFKEDYPPSSELESMSCSDISDMSPSSSPSAAAESYPVKCHDPPKTQSADLLSKKTFFPLKSYPLTKATPGTSISLQTVHASPKIVAPVPMRVIKSSKSMLTSFWQRFHGLPSNN
ncbi:hypothetical protein BGZ76_008467 [Entomortierella beljakovae]|nr:hypothetical protein BGZ76_008467 [Entomortierella beljakovae]